METPAEERFYTAILEQIRLGGEVLTGLLNSQRLYRAEYPPLLRLAQGWQWIVDRHSRSDGGRCEGCPPDWRGIRPAWPCPVVRAIHRALVD